MIQRKRFNNDSKGQSIVEFAVMVPILLLTIMVFLEMSFSIYYKIVLNHLLLDVARIVAISKDETSTQINAKIQAIRNAYANEGAFLFRTNDSSKFSITWEGPTTVNIIYKTITVQASYTGIQLPFIGPLPVSDELVFAYVDQMIVLP